MPHSNKKKGKKNASNASSSANSNSGLSNSSSPGSSKKCSSKSNQIKQNYRKDTKSLHKILTDKKSTMSQKRRASESLGEKAAICANSLRRGKQETESDYHISEGRDTFDLVHVDKKSGVVEVKEAKGGKSQYGTRKGLNNKPVTQCTKPYVDTIAQKMSTNNYKGRHPQVACAKHTGSPHGICKDCKAAERKRRKGIGNEVRLARANGKLKKIGVRGDYNQTGVKDPQVITTW